MNHNATIQLDWADEWTKGRTSWARGRAFLNGECLGPRDLALRFESASSPQALAALGESLTGHFAVMGSGGAGTFAVVDRTRSYPVFFSQMDGSVLLSDSPRLLVSHHPHAVPPREAFVDFAYAGYVTNELTLFPDVAEVPAATVLTHSQPNPAQLDKYGSFRPTVNGVLNEKAPVLLDMAYSTLECAIERMLEVVNGRTLVLPLSGGYDSRLLAMMINLSGYDRVLCYSYGRPGNIESQISKSVAEELGFKWLFVEYSERQWAEWTKSDRWAEYADLAHRGVSVPLMQGWPSTGALKSQSLVPNDSVFAPGLIGGIVSGYYAKAGLSKSRRMTRLEVARELVQDMYHLWWDEPSRALDLAGVAERIALGLGTDCFLSDGAGAAAYEDWVWREDQAKFVTNGARVYDYWGYDWWLPFADKEVVDFWTQVPYSERVDKVLYNRLVLDRIPDMLGSSSTSVLRRPKGRDKPIRRAARAIDALGLLRGTRNRFRPHLDAAAVYSSHHLGWWGAVSMEQFLSEYTGRENIYSFVTEQMLTDRYNWSRGQEIPPR